MHNIYLKLKYGVSTPEEAYNYCREHGCTPALEGIILTSPEYSYWYAKYIVKKKWPKCEKLILTSPEYSYWYAFNVLHDRWEESEEVILTSTEYSYLYAKYVIGGRWLRGENVILNSDYANSYRNFINE